MLAYCDNIASMRLRDWAFAASLAAAPGVAKAVGFGAKVGGHGGLGPVHLHLEGDFHDGEFGAHGDVGIGGEVCNRYLGERESCFELGAGAGFHLHDGEVEPAFVLGLGFGPAGFEFEVGEHEMEIAAQFGERIKLLLKMNIDTERGEASYGGGLAFCSNGETCGSVEVVEGHDGETMAVLGLSLAIGGHDHHGHEAH